MLIGKLRRAFAAIFPPFFTALSPARCTCVNSLLQFFGYTIPPFGINTPLHKVRRRVVVACIGRRLQFTSLWYAYFRDM